MFLQINDEDILPKNICNQCSSDLTFVYKFINKCQTSDEILQTTLTAHENTIECKKEVTEIKIEEHDLPLEPEFETGNTVVKEEHEVEVEFVDVNAKPTVSSQSK